MKLTKYLAGLRGLVVALSLTIPAITILPARAAELIYLDYATLKLEVPFSIDALEAYAMEGIIVKEFAPYINLLTPQQQEQLQQILLTPVQLSPQETDRFFYSPQGEAILRRIGEVVQTESGQPGFYQIRAGLIVAATDQRGLTLLNFLQKFPSQGIRVDFQRGFEILDQLLSFIEDTKEAIFSVENQSQAEITGLVDFHLMPDLTQPGKTTFSKETLTLEDSSRQRTFKADLYLPRQTLEFTAPLAVISHGLGSNRQTFEYLASHLASHGFAVAVPEHPGSNDNQLQQLLNGQVKEVTSARELLDRPQDIKYLLDRLELSYSRRINLERVAVIGQSFGGYTALALAGAKFNFQQLQQDCGLGNDSLNLSFLLQCLALELPEQEYGLKDDRVGAIIAINPLTSSIFGESQLSKLEIPLMLVSGSDDAVTPALWEQIFPFTWLKTAEKYLVLMKKGTHFSTLIPGEKDLSLPPEVIGPDPAIGQQYMKGLTLGFLTNYLLGYTEYQDYLSADYAQYLTQEQMPLSLVRNLPALY